MAKSQLRRLIHSSRHSLRLFHYRGRTRAYLRCTIFLALLLYYSVAFYYWAIPKTVAPTEPIQCDTPAGLENVFVLVRTSAAEIHSKKSVLLEPHLRCIPSYAIFSDLEEDILGHHVLDVLSDVSTEIKQANPDFELYTELKEKGAKKLRADGRSHDNEYSKRAEWSLEKWKFLPTLEKAWRMRPDAKWYFMVELDTYVVWSNLVQFLEKLDYREPYYIGATMALGMHEFAHGGSGIIISNAGLKKFVQHYSTHQSELEDLTAGQWAGDFVLGKSMDDAGVQHKGSWPLQQMYAVSGLDFAKTEPKRMWCAPALTYHHMSADERASLREFEDDWKAANVSTVLRHRDIFEYYILPQISLRRWQWDNFAGEEIVSEKMSEMTKEKCFLACREQPECKQYSVEKGLCRMSKTVHLGKVVTDERREIWSGWMRDRILHYFHHLIEPCGDEKDAFRI